MVIHPYPGAIRTLFSLQATGLIHYKGKKNQATGFTDCFDGKLVVKESQESQKWIITDGDLPQHHQPEPRTGIG